MRTDLDLPGRRLKVTGRLGQGAPGAPIGPPGGAAAALPLSSIKSMIGHLIGAAGAVEAAALALTLHDGVLPPTINQTRPDPECDLDYVPNCARELPVHVAVSTSFGFGGQNAALVMRRFVG